MADAIVIQTATGGSLSLQPGACVHLMGIGGVGMTSLAGLLVQRGFKVTGSDGPIYPPASDQLKALQLKPMVGYKAENLQHKPALVVVGNVITRQNPEAQALMQLGLPYISFPQALMQLAVEKSKPIVIAGTHGKTSTTALVAHVARCEGLAVGHMIGGQPVEGASFAYHKGGAHFILEGDEYDTAFFDKVPKFTHYQPHAVLLTSLEFDHADIYDNFDQVKKAFAQLIESIPQEGVLVACTRDKAICELLPRAKCPVVTYGLCDAHVDAYTNEDKKNDFTILDCEWSTKHKIQYIKLGLPHDDERLDLWAERGLHGLGEARWGDLEFAIRSPGLHNALNAVGAFALTSALGWNFDKKLDSLFSFKGVQRRSQDVGRLNGAVVIEDFAHHPTSVRLSLQMAAETYEGCRVWAVFEPRSNTSRRKVFQDKYLEALTWGDKILVAPVYDQSRIAEDERLDVARLVDDLNDRGLEARQRTVDEMVEILQSETSEDDVIVIMSNGRFGDLIKKLKLKPEGD